MCKSLETLLLERSEQTYSHFNSVKKNSHLSQYSSALGGEPSGIFIGTLIYDHNNENKLIFSSLIVFDHQQKTNRKQEKRLEM